MAKLSKEDILKLAKLSKLKLSDEEVERFRKEIESIFDYIEQLQSVDVSGLKPTEQVTGLENVTRPDVIKEYESREELLKNLPASEDGQIKVKRMIG